MGRQSTTTFYCDICEKNCTVEGTAIPLGWMERKGKIVCHNCIVEIIMANKKLADEICHPPVDESYHPRDCGCQACNPHAD